MENLKKKAIVIGAGVAGLAAAIRLSKMGYQVALFEANSFVGGKLSEIRMNQFRFDAGPSLFTMPHLVTDLIELCGQPLDLFPYRKLSEVCRYFFSDKTRFSASADINQLAKSLHKNLGENQENIIQYLDRARFKYETVGRLFVENCLRKTSTFTGPLAWKAYKNLHKLGLFYTLHEANKKSFSNPKTVQLFDRYATYNGSDPYKTPAIMGMIPHLEFGIGAFFPENGMLQITRTLEQLAINCRVEFHLGNSVNCILQNKERGAYGIESQGEKFEADVVVSAIDINRTYQLLKGKESYGSSYSRLPKSTSAIIFYWGIQGQFPQLGLHNLFFSADYAAEFHALFEKKTIPDEPSIYVNISCKERSSDAPANCENWFVMVNAPANEGQNWTNLVTKIRKIVLRRLSSELNTDIESLILEETHLDPISLESRTGGIGGALYGSNSNSRFAAFLRHANFADHTPHLYFCGGTVHPGGGIPLALQSAALVASYVKERE